MTKSYHSPLLYELMFLMVRHVLNILWSMINNNYENNENKELIVNSVFFINGRQLLKYEFELVKEFYGLFFEHFYLNRINCSFGKEDCLKTNMKGLYDSYLGEDNLIIHLLSNCVSNTFNHLKENT